jgi:hypothetical protein
MAEAVPELEDRATSRSSTSFSEQLEQPQDDPHRDRCTVRKMPGAG